MLNGIESSKSARLLAAGAIVAGLVTLCNREERQEIVDADAKRPPDAARQDSDANAKIEVASRTVSEQVSGAIHKKNATVEDVFDKKREAHEMLKELNAICLLKENDHMRNRVYDLLGRSECGDAEFNYIELMLNCMRGDTPPSHETCVTQVRIGNPELANRIEKCRKKKAEPKEPFNMDTCIIEAAQENDYPITTQDELDNARDDASQWQDIVVQTTLNQFFGDKVDPLTTPNEALLPTFHTPEDTENLTLLLYGLSDVANEYLAELPQEERENNKRVFALTLGQGITQLGNAYDTASNVDQRLIDDTLPVINKTLKKVEEPVMDLLFDTE